MWSEQFCRTVAIVILLLTNSTAGAQTREDDITDLLAQASARLAAVRASGTGTQIELTLEEAIARSLERNLDLAVERLNPQVFDLNLAQQLSAYRPSVNSSLSNSSRTNPSSTQLDGGNSVISDTATFNSGWTQAVPWGGGNYQVNLNNNRSSSTNFFSSFNPSYRSSFQASYTQPLLRGFKIDTTRQEIRVTRINRDIADIAAEIDQHVIETVAIHVTDAQDLVPVVLALGVEKAHEVGDRL